MPRGAHTDLMLLTQSSWASTSVLMCLEDTGSKRRTSVCSQATVNTDLTVGDKDRRAGEGGHRFG